MEAIKRSIKEFGFISPCLIDKDYNLIAGHGRIKAAKELGMFEVPCLFIEGLTEALALRGHITTRLGGNKTWAKEI